MQWQKEYFYPWKLFKIFFFMESFRKNNPCANGFEKEKKRCNEGCVNITSSKLSII